MYPSEKPARGGWNSNETERLFDLARAAEKENRPLREVFDRAAEEFSRRPNSVRNYYYAQMKTMRGADDRRAFETFSPEEARALVTAILRAKAKGESVRACTLRMAEGDDKRMLRYQNKYRAMLRNEPETVRAILSDMKANGEPTVDPYAPTKRCEGTETGATYGLRMTHERKYVRVLRMLENVDGFNVPAFMEAIGRLAERANAKAGVDTDRLSAENAALKAQLMTQHERYRVLLGYLTKLIGVNSAFLNESKDGTDRRGGIDAYLRALESSMAGCESVLQQA